VAAVIIWKFVDDVADPGSLWPLAAVTIYFLIYIYTPGEGGGGPNNDNGWGEFPKEHEVNAAYVMFVVWICYRLLRATDGQNLRLFAGIACLLMVGFLEQPTPIVLGAFLFTLAVILLRGGRARDAGAFLVMMCAAGI